MFSKRLTLTRFLSVLLGFASTAYVLAAEQAPTLLQVGVGPK